MPLLPKKRHEFNLRGQVDISDENPSCLSSISETLFSNGFKPFPADEYSKPSAEVAELLINFQGDPRPFVKINILGHHIIGLLDSGAQCSVLGIGAEKLLKSLKLKTNPSNFNLITAAGKSLPVTGCVDLPVHFNSQDKIVPMLIAPNLNRRLILGADFWRMFNIRPTILPRFEIDEIEQSEGDNCLSDSQKAQLDEIKSIFKTANDGECLNITSLISHKIEIKDEYKHLPPIRINPYPTSPQIQQKINIELDNLLAQKVIEKSHSNWSLSTVPVIKPNGEVRLCLDARRLNERTQRDAYPLPHQDRILSRLEASKYLSTIDLTKAFLQIPLESDSRKFTAFSILGRGLFHFTRLPFGLVNSPATLSRLMDEVLGYGELEPGVFVYLDDIVVVSNTFEEHLASLREVANRLSAANLSVNLEKSKFCVDELPYLGYLLTPNGLKPNPDRIEAIINYERPTSVRALRRYLGMANYYRRFIHHFSEITASLTNLLKKKPKSIIWNQDAEQAFVHIKECLVSAPILCNPDFSRPFQIQSDASDTAVAAVLTQQYDDGERVIAYFSHKLTPAQQAYAASEKEGLAVLSAIDKFRPYIEGTRFTVVTDASALTHIMRGKWRTSSRLSRWSIELQGYDLEIKHRKGRDNIVPDALSRAVESLSLQNSNDVWYAEMMTKVKQSPDEHPDFKIEQDKIYKLVPTKNEVLDYSHEWKLCIPHELRSQILQKEHDDSLHIGFEKTLDRIKKLYFWPKMSSFIQKYVRNCRICKESKPSNTSQHPEMGKQRLVTKPFQILSIDYIQSLPRSKTGNAHLLVLLDMFSKWTVLVPVKKISSALTVKIIEEQWFRRYSVPEILISDNATSFVGHEFKAFLDKYKVKHWTNARHHSQANPVERLNRSINSCIRSYVKSDQRLWDTRISEIEHIINNTLHTSTGFTPYRILFGHEIISNGQDHLRQVDTQDLTSEARIDRKLEIDKTLFHTIRKNLEKAHEHSKQNYNLRFQKPAPVYQVGQQVYRRNFTQSSAVDGYNAKLGPAYLPCTVVSRRGTSSYELADEKGKIVGIFSAADLKPGISD